MSSINQDIFNHNLELTKEYCRLQMEGNEKNIAKIFRSYNPLLDGKPLFSFDIEYFDFEIEPNINYCMLTNWAIDPLNNNIIETLFDGQLAFKKHCIPNSAFKESSSGRIIVSEFDCTVLDGASEVQSLGLVDIYDLPPIDTWFYIIKNQGFRTLFAWIPDEYTHYANEALVVNCLDCLHWFEE